MVQRFAWIAGNYMPRMWLFGSITEITFVLLHMENLKLESMFIFSYFVLFLIVKRARGGGFCSDVSHLPFQFV